MSVGKLILETVLTLTLFDGEGIGTGWGTCFTFVSTTGDTAGIKVKYSGLGADATVYYGESLISKFTTYISSVLETSGVLNNRVSTLTDEVSNQNVLIADLDEKFEATRSRYVQQFTAMEQAVTSMKNTGDYLTNLFEAMNKDK